MAGSPLFTIVDSDTQREVKLLDHNGVPNAIPLSQSYSNEDHRYRYSDGTIGKSPLIHRHQIELGCDFMPDEIRRRLLRMQMDRADVLFTPGFGESTVLAWHPVEVDGTTLPSGDTFYDLTGNVALTCAGGGSRMVWDSWTEQTGKAVEPDGTSPALVVETPYGAAQSLQPAVTNRWGCGEPQGDEEGYDPNPGPTGDPQCGWRKGGTDSGQITFQFVSGGFAPAGLNALRVTTTNDVSTSRYLEADGLWDSSDADYLGYTFSGNSVVSVSLWVKGRFNRGAYLSLLAVNTSSGVPEYFDTVSLYSGDYSDWTKLSLNIHLSSWASHRPSVQLGLSSNSGGEAADFMVSAMTIKSGRYSSHVRWSPYDTATTGEKVYSASMTKPKSGSVTMSFFVPDDIELVDSGLYCLCQLNPSTTNSGWLTIYRTSTGIDKVLFYYDGTDYLEGQVDLSPGVHVATASWGTRNLKLYYDGELCESSTTDYDVTFTDSGPVSIGATSYSPHPVMPLSVRLDAELHADDYADIHAALLDSVSLGAITAARGRRYEITGIPSTPRILDGQTCWTGTIKLSQVGYDADLADVTTKEY